MKAGVCVTKHILEVKDIKYNYPDSTEALKGINIKIGQGETTAL